VAKAAIGNGSRDFTINNSGVYGPTVEFIVYDAAAGEAVIDGVTASLSGSTLTLTKSDADEKGMAERRYYLSAQYASNDESDSRLMLRVLPQVVDGYALFFGNTEAGLTNLASSNLTTGLCPSTPVKSGEPTLVTGVNGGTAANLDSSNYVKIETSAGQFNWKDSFTVAFWVQVDSFTDQRTVFTNFSPANATNGPGVCIWQRSASRYWDFRIVNGNAWIASSNSGNNLDGNVDPETKWHHIAVVVTKQADSENPFYFQFYYDGVTSPEGDGLNPSFGNIAEQSANGNTLAAKGLGGRIPAELCHTNGLSSGNNSGGAAKIQDFILTEGAYTAAQIAALAAQ
jgi:hypothetical protein